MDDDNKLPIKLDEIAAKYGYKSFPQISKAYFEKLVESISEFEEGIRNSSKLTTKEKNLLILEVRWHVFSFAAGQSAAEALVTSAETAGAVLNARDTELLRLTKENAEKITEQMLTEQLVNVKKNTGPLN